MKDKEWEKAIVAHLRKEGWGALAEDPKLADNSTDVWQTITTKRNVGRPGRELWIVLRADLWGCIDIAAMSSLRGFLFIQACTTAGVSERRRKIEAHGWPLLGSAYSEVWGALGREDPREGGRIVYRVQIWEARARRRLADARAWDYAARVHDYDPVTGSWNVLPDHIPIT